MDITTRKVGDVTIVDFKGRLAVGVSDSVLPRIVGEILGDGSKKILLNLSDMDYIDSNGLGELVQVFRESKRGGASLRLLKPHDRVTKTLRQPMCSPISMCRSPAADRRPIWKSTSCWTADIGQRWERCLSFRSSAEPETLKGC